MSPQSLFPILSLCALSACVSWVPVHAQDTTPKRLGPVVSFGLGVGGCDGGTAPFPCAGEVESGFGAELSVGYRFHEVVSVSVLYQENLLRPQDETNVDLNYALLGVDTRLHILHTGPIDPHISFGAGFFSITSAFRAGELIIDIPDQDPVDLSGRSVRFDASGYTFHVGGGVAYYLVPSVSLGLSGKYIFAPEIGETCIRAEGSTFCEDTGDNDQSNDASYWSTYLTAYMYFF